MEESRNLVKLLGLVALAAISVMAVSASAAQAKYLLLLNGASVTSLTQKLTQIGNGSISFENGLKLECTGGSGTATASLSGTAEKVTGSTTATFTGCVWVGSEKTCTINDGGNGLIKTKASSEIIMEGSNYLTTETSSEFTTILTEGAFCTIPEEVLLSGTGHTILENPLANTKLKTRLMLNLNLWGAFPSDVTSVVIKLSVVDTDPNATFGTHLTNLTGCTPIC